MNSSQSAVSTPLGNVTFAVVDVETTGLSCQADKIIEIAAVKMSAGQISDVFESLIYTDYIPFRATMVHGIDVFMVRDAPRLEAVKDKFAKFTEGCVLAGHNIRRFDMHFLRRDFGVPADALCVDTISISKMLFPCERYHSLDVVAARLSLRNARHHRAAGDAFVTAQILCEFLNMGKDKFKRLKDVL
ncbi:MAG: 3'-5' exonuclease [Planctomycetes bacterium]|nr:3'-5' exonuclease [Planctomycetota bacterium]